MGLIMRPYAGDADLSPIAELIRALPAMGRHLVDFPWRLSAPIADPTADARVCMADGLVVGFAAWQDPWATLDVYIHPEPSQPEVEAAIFDWAAGRFRELDAARGQPLPYWVEAREDDAEHLALLGVARSIRENCTLRPASAIPTQLRRGRIGVIVGAGAGSRTVRA